MNKVILLGRLVRDPDVRVSADGATTIARYTIAVDRRFKKEGEESADFISCVAFGKTAEFAEKYLRKGIKIAVEGRIQTGSYTNREGQKVYTTDVVVETSEFAESKAASDRATGAATAPAADAPAAPKSRKTYAKKSAPAAPPADSFMDIPDEDDEELPFA